MKIDTEENIYFLATSQKNESLQLNTSKMTCYTSSECIALLYMTKKFCETIWSTADVSW